MNEKRIEQLKALSQRFHGLIDGISADGKKSKAGLIMTLSDVSRAFDDMLFEMEFQKTLGKEDKQ